MMAAAILRTDRWQAGMALMQEASPNDWHQLIADSDLGWAHREAAAEPQVAADKGHKAPRASAPLKSTHQSSGNTRGEAPEQTR
jgi:hypothetical protein